MSKKVYVDLSQQDVQDIINAYEKDIEKFKKQKEVINKAIEYTNQFINFKTSRIDEWENVELVLETIVNILQGKEN